VTSRSLLNYVGFLDFLRSFYSLGCGRLGGRVRWFGWLVRCQGFFYYLSFTEAGTCCFLELLRIRLDNIFNFSGIIFLNFFLLDLRFWFARLDIYFYCFIIDLTQRWQQVCYFCILREKLVLTKQNLAASRLHLDQRNFATVTAHRVEWRLLSQKRIRLLVCPAAQQFLLLKFWLLLLWRGLSFQRALFDWVHTV